MEYGLPILFGQYKMYTDTYEEFKKNRDAYGYHIGIDGIDLHADVTKENYSSLKQNCKNKISAIIKGANNINESTKKWQSTYFQQVLDNMEYVDLELIKYCIEEKCGELFYSTFNPSSCAYRSNNIIIHLISVSNRLSVEKMRYLLRKTVSRHYELLKNDTELIIEFAKKNPTTVIHDYGVKWDNQYPQPQETYEEYIINTNNLIQNLNYVTMIEEPKHKSRRFLGNRQFIEIFKQEMQSAQDNLNFAEFLKQLKKPTKIFENRDITAIITQYI